MSYYPLGHIIKNRREELQLSQEDLADGICAVATLSRIENGERMPSKNHYEMLMQRLGYAEEFTQETTEPSPCPLCDLTGDGEILD